MEQTNLRELIEFLARAMVDNPNEVEVNEVVGEQTIVLELRVAKDDIGKVIGKHGRTAQSLRTILNAVGTKLKVRCVLEIVE